MIDQLTPNTARMLDKALRFYENVLSQKDIPHEHNAGPNLDYTWASICHYTDAFMKSTVYSVPGVVAPTE